ncbi:hypothetical protein AT15_01525 [Kosmotoga arenicorallina S304]|uniref:DUF2207 domain-containing protein n=1 Tax=Kosmotoga arenicorallina S304 TaxID=1453497 RepID=A0A176K017_9BACT|nr:DUF2207 domain-containing protein [Kosmotoga arenicorallina]OAA29741.1 hypothetical protein AT15_01525 [Kosmotoga arenicorallina S304]
MKKLVVRSIIIGIVTLVVWFIVSIFVGGTNFQSKYRLEKAEIEHKVMEDGTMQVHEKIDYRMVKPYRGLLRDIPSDWVKYRDLRVWTEGMNYTKIENFSTENSINLRVWLVPYNGSPRTPAKDGDPVTLHISYTVEGIVQEGNDVSQIFRKYWGEGWEQPVKNLKASFTFPDKLTPINIYSHPPIEAINEGNRYIFEMRNMPSRTFGEVRFLFPEGYFENAKKGNFSLSDIESIEESFKGKVNFWKYYLPVVLAVLTIVVLFVIFYFMGREPNIAYDAYYERELPTNDEPELVNAIVKNLCMGVDNDGIGACILNLYRRGYVDFNVNPKKEKVEGIIIKKATGTDLASTERQLLSFFAKYAIDFGEEKVFDFGELKRRFRGKQSEARKFTQELNAWKSLIKGKVRERKYLLSSGAWLSKLYSVFLIFISFFTLISISSSYELGFLSDYARYIYGIFAVTGAIVFFLPVDVFGRWTKTGREYYLKWKNFENFLKDYSLLSEYPPSSVVLWEEYLVYATALGIAEEVRKHMSKIVPEDLWKEEGGHMYMYYPYGLYVSRDFGSVVSSANVSSSSSSGGSGAGGVGGGSGGGGGGAF